MRWQRARKKDLHGLLKFLIKQEWRAVPFTSRLKKQNKEYLPSRMDASVFIRCDKSGIYAALLFTSHGLLLPVFHHNPSNSLELARFNELKRITYSIHSVMGSARDVSRVEQSLSFEPKISVNYHLMTLTRAQYGQIKESSTRTIPGLIVRHARLEDLEKLFPLHKNYELEEVLVSYNHFHERSSLLNLKRILQRQVVIMAELNKKTVAKANTNARGFLVDQIGGVYTIESERNREIGFLVMRKLLDNLFLKKKMVSLFVKQDNFQALSLYRKLGFKISDCYRISYYQA